MRLGFEQQAVKHRWTHPRCLCRSAVALVGGKNFVLARNQSIGNVQQGFVLHLGGKMGQFLGSSLSCPGLGLQFVCSR